MLPTFLVLQYQLIEQKITVEHIVDVTCEWL